MPRHKLPFHLRGGLRMKGFLMALCVIGTSATALYILEAAASATPLGAILQ